MCVCMYICMYACMSICPSISPLEPERLVWSGRANIQSMRQNGGKTMLTVSDRLVARGKCQVRWCKPLQKRCSQGCRINERTDSAQTWWADIHHGWAQSVFSNRLWRPFTRAGGTWIMIWVFAHERRVQLGREGHRSTRTDGSKIALLIVGVSWVRIPTNPER